MAEVKFIVVVDKIKPEDKIYGEYLELRCRVNPEVLIRDIDNPEKIYNFSHYSPYICKYIRNNKEALLYYCRQELLQADKEISIKKRIRKKNKLKRKSRKITETFPICITHYGLIEDIEKAERITDAGTGD